MEAIQEVGLKKVFRFFVYTLIASLFDHSLFPPVRATILRLCGAQIGKGTVIHNIKFFNLYYQGFKGLKIGNYCYLGPEVMIDLAGEVKLENHVTVSNRALLLTHLNVGYKNHPLQKYFPRSIKSIHLQRGAFIGVNATILPGVTIGQESAVGAASLVRQSVPDHTVVAGVPARRIKKLK